MRNKELVVLLIKYVAHNAAAEGLETATSLDFAPCHMLDMEFSEEEKKFLLENIFPVVTTWEMKLRGSSD